MNTRDLWNITCVYFLTSDQSENVYLLHVKSKHFKDHIACNLYFIFVANLLMNAYAVKLEHLATL